MTFAWLHMSVASASFVELGTSPVTLLSYTFILLGLHPMLEAQIQWLSAQLRICTKGLSWDGNERVLESVTSCKLCTAGNLFFIKNWSALISLQFNHLLRSSSMSKSLLVSCSVSLRRLHGLIPRQDQEILVNALSVFCMLGMLVYLLGAFHFVISFLGEDFLLNHRQINANASGGLSSLL